MLGAISTGDVLVVSLGQPFGMAWDGSRSAFLFKTYFISGQSPVISPYLYSASRQDFFFFFLIYLLNPLILVLYKGKKSVCKYCVITGLTTVMW